MFTGTWNRSDNSSNSSITVFWWFDNREKWWFTCCLGIKLVNFIFHKEHQSFFLFLYILFFIFVLFYLIVDLHSGIAELHNWTNLISDFSKMLYFVKNKFGTDLSCIFCNCHFPWLPRRWYPVVEMLALLQNVPFLVFCTIHFGSYFSYFNM